MIHATKAGRWKVTVDVGAGGARKRVSRTVDTEAEAVALEARLRGDGGAAAALSTFADIAGEYVAMRSPDLAPQTELHYRRILRLYLEPCWFGRLRLDQLDVMAWRRFEAELRAGTYLADNPAAIRARRLKKVAPLAASTVRGVHLFVSTVLNDCVDLELLERNPIRTARKRRDPARRRPEVRDYRLEDVRAVLAAADVDLREAVHLAVVTGARIGELCALRWCDVNLTGATVTIDGTASRNRANTAWYRKPTTKTDRPRPLTVDAATVAMLEDRYRRQLEDCTFAGVDPATLETRAVLSRELEDGYTSPPALRNRWHRAREAAGVKLKFHDLRRIACSEMSAAGVPVADATARSGHASQAVYFDVYGAVRARDADPALDALATTWATITGD
jgi:integrase